MNEPFTYESLSDFGTILRCRRKAMGLTMIQVSEYAGIGRNHYSRIEAGILSPRTAYLSIFRILMCLKLTWTITVRPIPDEVAVPIHFISESIVDIAPIHIQI